MAAGAAVMVSVQQKQKQKQKRKRPDVAAKLECRKRTQEVVVKAALLKHLRGASTKALLRDAIRARVESYSKRMHIASTALSGLVKQCFMDAPDVVDAALPDFDQTFFRQLMLGVAGTDAPNVHVQSYYNSHPRLMEKLNAQPRHLGDSNIYSAGAKLYQTNFRNAFVVNFEPRLKTYLRGFQDQYHLSDDQRVWMLYAIHGWAVGQLTCQVPTLDMVAAVEQQRRILGLRDAEQVTQRWMDMSNHLHGLVRHAVHLCRLSEAAGRRPFDVVPIARRGAHFVTIDTSVLYGIMKELRLVTWDYELFDLMREEQWGSVLNLDKILGARRASDPDAFTGTVQSDGISVCVHYRKAKVVNSAPYVIQANPGTSSPLATRADELTVLGMDPGRANIYCFALQRPDGTTKTWKMTRCKYYNDCGITKAKKQTETWQKKVRNELQSLAGISTKGMSVTRHEAFLDANMDAFDNLWAEYMKPRWARQRLRLYGGKQRTFATFLNRVGDEAKYEGGGKPLAVAYGAAKFAPGGRGEVSVPTSRAYKECASRFETVLVNEYRTTRVSAQDGSLLKAVMSRQKGSAVRGLLWYDSTNVSKFVDRDLNAALNIRWCAVLGMRPIELCRAGQPALGPAIVGKTIRC